MTTDPHAWVTAYLADADRSTDLDRLTTTPSGLDPAGVAAVLADPRLGRLGIEAMSDLMHPTDSMYYDAIYGAFHGQVAIRNWLIPTMATIDFIEFVPTQPGAEFHHADGTASSVDEWQMWAVFGDDRIPLPRGVSTRHFADGWITWNADVYDTAAFRVPPPDGTEAPPLPAPPTTPWQQHSIEPAATSLTDLRDHLHPDVVYRDPAAGELEGRAAVATYLDEAIAALAGVRRGFVGPRLTSPTCRADEWVLQANGGQPDRRGTSVRRLRDGLVIDASEYYDTAG